MANDHFVKFQDGWWTLECRAPMNSMCHSEYHCSCETYTDWRINDQGLPEHTGVGGETHVGRFNPTECGYRLWFEEGDGVELLEGNLTIPVTPRWEGDGYVFVLSEGQQVG